MNKKLSLVFVLLIFSVVLTIPVMAHFVEDLQKEDVVDFDFITHIASCGIGLFITIIAFYLASQLLAGQLAKGMVMVTIGFAFIVIDQIASVFGHFGMNIGLGYIYHLLLIVGFITMSYGFYNIYRIIKDVAMRQGFRKRKVIEILKSYLPSLKDWACTGFSRRISRTQKKQKARMQ